MELIVNRFAKAHTYTIGRLFIPGIVNDMFCNTLEDKVREEGVKIPGETAIPAGKYEVRLTESARFKKVLPEILNVPGFTGIRIHGGNSDKDTEGCILVGRNTEKGKLSQSQDTLVKLMTILQGAADKKEPIWITIG